ncbi:MAG TPA: hypothetical protein VIO38_17655 [Rariglobus sp.]
MKILSRHFLGENTSIAYPHGNGFTHGATHFVFCRSGAAGPRLLMCNLESSATVELPAIPNASEVPADAVICFDAALNAPRLAALLGPVAWILDLERGAEWRKVYSQPPDAKVQDLPSLSPDGRRLLLGEDRPGSHSVVEIDVDSLRSRTLFSKNWHANHFHYCPHDPSWIGFAHEGPAEKIIDRCWVWHATKAPEGRVVFDQYRTSDDPSRPLCIGHERWAFHDASAYVIAYAVSPVGKRGLYEMFADARSPRLLWESNTVWHCNMDASGRIAVIDTTAPWDPVPVSGKAYEEGVARHLQADRDRTSNLSDIVVLDLQSRTHLHVAEVVRTRHPYHPHPTLSPDGTWLAYTDAQPGKKGSWLLKLGHAHA